LVAVVRRAQAGLGYLERSWYVDSGFSLLLTK